MSLLYKKNRRAIIAQKGRIIMTSNGPMSVYTPEQEAEDKQREIEAEYAIYAANAQSPNYVPNKTIPTLTQSPEPQGAMGKMYDGIVNPMTALSYATDPRKGQVPDHLNRLIKQGAVGRNNFDIAVDTFNPFSLADFVSDFGSGTRNGDYLIDGMRAVSAIPMVRGAAGLLRPGSRVISNIAKNNIARSAWLDREVAAAEKQMIHRDAVIDRAKLIKKAGTTNKSQLGKLDTEITNNNNTEEFVNKLLDKGVIKNFDGKYLFLDRAGKRVSAVFNLDGVDVPFYQSINGTDGKTAGGWYPYFGNQGSWMVKGYIPDMQKGYNIPAIQNMQKYLNRNLSKRNSLDALVSKRLIRSPTSHLTQQTENTLDKIYPKDTHVFKNYMLSGEKLNEVVRGVGYKGKSTYDMFINQSESVFKRLRAQQAKSNVTKKFSNKLF